MVLATTRLLIEKILKNIKKVLTLLVKYKYFFISVLLATLVVIPMMIDGHFYELWGTEDFSFHINRIETITKTIRSGQYPGLVSFLSSGNVGSAINANYPWWTLAIFVIPRLLFYHHIKLSIFLGFFLVNFCCAYLMFLFLKKVTTEFKWQLLGVCLYLFNSWHLMLLWQRYAFGELLAYTFLPVVACGLISIWNKEKQGSLYLAVGVSLVANSHIISSVILVLILTIIEIYRIVIKKFPKFELKSILKSATLSLFLLSGTIIPLILIRKNNKIANPFQPTSLSTMGVVPKKILGKILNNDFSTVANLGGNQFWHLGPVFTAVLLITTIFLIFNPKLRRTYLSAGLILSWILLLATTNYFPYRFLEIHGFNAIRTIQFPGRMLTFIPIILIPLAVIILKDSLNWKVGKLVSPLLVSGLSILLASQAMNHQVNMQRNYPQKMALGSQQVLDRNFHCYNRDYYRKPQNDGLIDFEALKNKIHDHKTDRGTNFNLKKIKNDQLHYQVKINNTHLVAFPVIKYEGLNYLAKVDKASVPIKLSTYQTVGINLSKGYHQVDLQVKMPFWYYLVQLIQIFSWLMTIFLLIRGRNKSKLFAL